eukprot:g7550.t1
MLLAAVIPPLPDTPFVLYGNGEGPYAMHGFAFNSSAQLWEKCRGTDERPIAVDGPLRCATLNVLHDNANADVLFHEVRYQAICKELQSLNAHIIGLNEVTRNFLRRLLEEDWVRKDYVLSAILDHSECAGLAATRGHKSFGNVILSKIPPEAIEYIPCPNRTREFHVASLRLAGEKNGKSVFIAVASVHFQAFPWINESRRQAELHALAAELQALNRNYDACIMMGDFNFHRESENSSIPFGWQEIPSIVALGPTWCNGENPMIEAMLPSYNIYNGFGTGWGWPNLLRLDRVLIQGTGLNSNEVNAKLFSNRPVYECIKHTGDEKVVVWKDYLYPSDHYGIVFDINLS